jgi:hypothetical protein
VTGEFDGTSESGALASEVDANAGSAVVEYPPVVTSAGGGVMMPLVEPF